MPEDKKVPYLQFKKEQDQMMRDLVDWVGKALITDVICPSCGHKNKAKKEWLDGVFVDECESCYDDLVLSNIFGEPYWFERYLKDTDSEKKPRAVAKSVLAEDTSNSYRYVLEEEARRKERAKAERWKYEAEYWKE